MKAWQLSPWSNWAVENPDLWSGKIRNYRHHSNALQNVDVAPLLFYCLCLAQMGTTTSLQSVLQSHLSQTYTDLILGPFLMEKKHPMRWMSFSPLIMQKLMPATTLIMQCLPQIDSNHVGVWHELAACFIKSPTHIPCVWDFLPLF